MTSQKDNHEASNTAVNSSIATIQSAVTALTKCCNGEPRKASICFDPRFQLSAAHRTNKAKNLILAEKENNFKQKKEKFLSKVQT